MGEIWRVFKEITQAVFVALFSSGALIVFSVLSGLWWTLYHVTGDPMLGAVIFPWLYAAVVFETYRLNLEKREKDK